MYAHLPHTLSWVCLSLFQYISRSCLTFCAWQCATITHCVAMTRITSRHRLGELAGLSERQQFFLLCPSVFVNNIHVGVYTCVCSWILTQMHKCLPSHVCIRMHAYFAEYTDTNGRTRSLHLFFPPLKLSKEKTQTALKKAHGSRLKESSANKESHSAKQENNQLQKETRELQKEIKILAKKE